MYYYKIDNKVYKSEIVLSAENGYGHAIIISLEQYNELLNPTPIEPTFEQKQNIKLSVINSVYANKMIEGYFDVDTNITLKLFKDDRDAFNQLITDTFVINETSPTASVFLADTNGAIHELTALAFKSLMQRYGAYYKQLWGTLLYFENLVKQCVNEIELNQIVWN